MREHNYAILITPNYIDGEFMYEATVPKFPDIYTYGSNPDYSYRAAVHLIKELIELARELKHEIPEPDLIIPMMEPALDYAQDGDRQ